MIEKTKRYVSPGKMLKQAQKTKGYLFKKSNGILSGWSQKYFIIFNAGINYYDDETLQKLRGEIKLKDVQSVIIKDPNLFSLQTSKKQYLLRCENKQVRDLWIASLNLLKEYVSDDDISKRFVIKKDQNQLKAERFQLCSINDLKNVLIMMNLNLLAKQLDQSRIHQRIYCQKVKDCYYLSVSIKCLECAQIDEQILSEKYIIPFSFNKLYKVKKDGKVEDIGRMSQMQSLKTLEDSVVITFPDKKRILFPFKNQSQIDQISSKLCRCYQVGKEYYNPFKIVLKKNIDRLLYLYYNFRDIFDQKLKLKIEGHLQKCFKLVDTSSVEIFLSQFKMIKKDLIQTEQACKVFSPSKEDVKFAYFRTIHQEVRVFLPKIWQNLFAKFLQKHLISFSNQLYEYWVIVNPVVGDSSLLQGCFDLNTFFMSRAGQSIKQKIQEFSNKKIKYKKMKKDPIANQLTYSVYEWIQQVNSSLNQIIPLEVIINQYCKFFSKCFDQFLQYLQDISEKWNQISVIIGACNDLSRIKSYLITQVCPQLCKGVLPEKKFYSMCGNQILKKMNECLGNLIKRAFTIIFKTIDKKLLAKHFIQIDFCKICYQVLQRLQPFKSKLFDDVQYQMVILSFDEICFFLYTTFINKNIPTLKNKNVKEYYVKVIDKSLISIQQYYCNIKTQNYVKNYLKEIINLKQILICPQNLIHKYCSDLRVTFGTSFTQQNLNTILKIRQISQQSFKKIMQLCSNILKKSPSSQDSQSYQQIIVRARKSTLNQQAYSLSEPESNLNQNFSKQGYLQMKKIVKGMPNFFNRSYFRIGNRRLLQYYSSTSIEILSSIQLEHVDYCYLDSQGTDKCTFIIIVDCTNYFFKALNRDEAGLWIQAIYSQIKSPLFQNKSQVPLKQTKNSLFKNLQSELTTTCTNQRNTISIGETQKLEQKHWKKQKIQQYDSTNSKQDSISSTKKSLNRKEIQDKRRLIQKEDEGVCCSRKMFWI